MMSTARLWRRLREHDWMAALIELAIVIVGILIALEVSNWNEGRLDRDRAAHFLQRIHGDLLTDRRNIDATLAFWAKVARYGDAAIAYGESGRPADGPAWNTVLAYYQASQTMPYTATDTTFEEMRSSGDLGLIADERLRTELAEFYRQSSNKDLGRILQHDPVYRTQIRAITPWATQRYIWEHCFGEASYYEQTLVDCPSPMSEQEATALLGTYQRTPALLDNLRAWMSLLRISDIVLRNTRETAERIIAQTGTPAR
ncbi:MAG TPA: hypothetical protein VFV97_00160 [Rhodanobacteraceae bacterium]|nr:hypothetical protein [Rhodanobacteraceae bacterium]